MAPKMAGTNCWPRPQPRRCRLRISRLNSTSRPRPPISAPISGQYLLLNRALRGEAILPGDLALSWIVPAILTLLALWGIARRFSNESILVGK